MNTISIRILLLVTGLALVGCSGSGGGGEDRSSSASSSSVPDGMIVNPVAPEGHDPFVVRHQNHYYYIYSHQGSIWINDSDRLEEVVQFEGARVWTPPPGESYSESIWAPELFFLDDRWYIYFAADDGDNANHRMYVLSSDNADPLSEYRFEGQISDPSDRWAIDGTILELDDQRYFIWSGWPGDENVQQNLYIAPMSGPTQISGDRVLISEPEFEWERIGGDHPDFPYVNEGPQVLKHEGRVFVVYSASGSWTDHYSLGLLELMSDDPLRIDSWYKHDEPVFSGTDNVISPGHASFTLSPDGSEHWIVYHSAKYKGAGWDRDVSMQPFEWNTDGTPDFGSPVDKGEPIPAPQ
ncbi:glycoside hydrolase family 43 protein [Marinimicrobium sp. C6131]|uniref:glycoside hydrolase family 43 protein n=1 Tax=Marinimicrobium sp. C6131 TaxID=3022676 RepID=UPI00223D639F|nr:glycoside hydrolase family 43 protein [Marinimicrobium sp. C6131]UZJ43622.1 glycoside hydrolase family 43 protein [Marinimicrobium sp. C6131]